MPLPYTEFRYFYPPRTQASAPYNDPDVFGAWRAFPDAVAQLKYKGKRTMAYVAPNRTVQFWDRHAKKQDYQPKGEMLERLLSISPAGKWTVWDGELMNYQTKDIKDGYVLYDCLVWDSEQQIKVPYRDRLMKIQNAIGLMYPPLAPAEWESGKVYAIQTWPQDYWGEAWSRALHRDFLEGLVLKRTGMVSRLDHGHVEQNNGGWMCRVRKPTNLYQH